MVNPSCAKSKVSMAASFPSDFKLTPVTLVGHAFDNFQTIVGLPASSSKLIVTSSRCIVFIFILLNQSNNLLSALKTPFFRLTLLVFFSPGILIFEKTGLLPCRYSITWASISRPDTSLKAISPRLPNSTLK